MLELATAREDGDAATMPAELRLYPARSRTGKQERLQERLQEGKIAGLQDGK